MLFVASSNNVFFVWFVYFVVTLLVSSYFVVKKKKPLGDDLLSREVALQVPSALTSLTAGFEMLPGVPTSLKSPRDFIHKSWIE